MDVPHSWTKERIEEHTDVWGMILSSDDPLGEAVSYSDELVAVVDETPRSWPRNRN
jgi:hypothetical protein